VGKRHKGPSYQIEPVVGKLARAEERPERDTNRLLWSFSKFDTYDWTTKGSKTCSFCHVGDHMRDYESRGWTAIYANPKRDHPIALGDLCKDAQERVRELSLDDYEELFSFHFAGRERLWGIEIHHVFHVLWWDPDHQICPSEKKNT